MDFEKDRERQSLLRSYRISGAGFSVYGFGMLLSSLISVGMLVMMLGGFGPLGQQVGIDQFDFLHHTFRAWTRVFATFCIWAAWQEPSWRRRSGLLLVLSMIDMALWAVEIGVREGYWNEADSHPLLRSSSAAALGWARFGLIAGIVGTFAEHTGNSRLEAFSKRARSTSFAGATLWFFFFLEQIDWARPWPLRQRPPNASLMMIYLAQWVLTTICLIQASYLCLVSGRDASRIVRAMRAEDASHDPWK